MKKLLKLLTMAVMFNATVAIAEKEITIKPDHTLGQVNGEKFYAYDWNAEFYSLAESVRKQGESKLFLPVRNAVIERMAIADKASKDGIENSISYKSAIRKAKRDILTRLYLEKAMAKQPSKSQLKKEYAKFKKELTKQKQINARHILVKSRKDAEKIIKAIQNGADFIVLAKTKSTGPSGKNGGDLGWFSRGAMVPTFDKAVFGLKDGQLASKPVKTKFGWHIIKREKSRTQPVPAFKDVQDVLRSRIGQAKIEKIIADILGGSKIVVFDENGKEIKLN